jgi:hypothetical protein
MTTLDLFKRGARKVTQAILTPVRVLSAALAENRIHCAAQARVANVSKTHGVWAGRAR